MTESGEAPSARRLSARTVLLTIFIPVVAPLSVVLVAIWGAATWTNSQENKLVNLNSRVAILEAITHDDPLQNGRLDQLEYRLNWMDKEKNRDREETQRLNQEIRSSLERLNNAVIRLETLSTGRRSR